MSTADDLPPDAPVPPPMQLPPPPVDAEPVQGNPLRGVPGIGPAPGADGYVAPDLSRYSGPGGEPAGTSFAEAAMWVATAVGSGVLGNAAYDALKAMFRRESTSETFTPSEREQIARLAVRARCAEVGVPMPRDSAPCRVVLAGGVYELDYGDLRAKVRVPEAGLSGVEVTLYQVR